MEPDRWPANSVTSQSGFVGQRLRQRRHDESGFGPSIFCTCGYIIVRPGRHLRPRRSRTVADRRRSAENSRLIASAYARVEKQRHFHRQRAPTAFISRPLSVPIIIWPADSTASGNTMRLFGLPTATSRIQKRAQLTKVFTSLISAARVPASRQYRHGGNHQRAAMCRSIMQRPLSLFPPSRHSTER